MISTMLWKMTWISDVHFLKNPTLFCNTPNNRQEHIRRFWSFLPTEPRVLMHKEVHRIETESQFVFLSEAYNCIQIKMSFYKSRIYLYIESLKPSLDQQVAQLNQHLVLVHFARIHRTVSFLFAIAYWSCFNYWWSMLHITLVLNCVSFIFSSLLNVESGWKLNEAEQKVSSKEGGDINPRRLRMLNVRKTNVQPIILGHVNDISSTVCLTLCVWTIFLLCH